MNSPLRILSTALAGTGGRADDKTSGTALPTGAGPRLLSGVANSEAREDMPEVGVDPPGVEETTSINPATDINGSAPRAALVIKSGTDTTGRPESERSHHHHMTWAGVPNPQGPPNGDASGQLPKNNRRGQTPGSSHMWENRALRGHPTSQTETHSDLATASTGDPIGPLRSHQPKGSPASKRSPPLTNIPLGGQPCEGLHLL